ncbi:MAG TPA: flagellar biosynthetic protein FliO [Xanthobacteraceae bacterium]|nr:flagellar biosynthetic protein FliO [Xanthobacteraceae bacterium]
MRDILGMDLGLAPRFIIAFVLVLALIGLTAWLIRQFGSARASNSGGNRNRVPRLAVLDSTVVDARRRLVLIRRDNVEHLILIGGPSDVVVEENIVRGQPATAPSPMQRQAPPRATIELEPEYDPSLVPYDEPVFEEPRPATARPVLQRPAPRSPEPARPAPAAPRPAPAARQDQFDDVTKRLEAALRQPAAESALARPKAEPRVAPTPAPATRPATEARPMAPTPPAPAPAPAPTPAQKGGDDVFASLEEEMASLLRPNERKNPS